jgi:hypothetical protein
MFEYHGWINVRAIYENMDFTEEKIVFTHALDKIKKRMSEISMPHGFIDYRGINIHNHIWTSGYCNHRPTDMENPVYFFKFVGMTAPGSYGLLFIRDSEDIFDNNMFRIYVLTRGIVTEHKDPFLSPAIPIIADEAID